VTSDSLGGNYFRLEHVTVLVDIRHTRRGDLRILLTSPSGTVSVLATERVKDTSTEGLRDWTFMTVKSWGEYPLGTWVLKVIDNVRPESTGTIPKWVMALYGESSPKPFPGFESSQTLPTLSPITSDQEKDVADEPDLTLPSDDGSTSTTPSSNSPSSSPSSGGPDSPIIGIDPSDKTTIIVAVITASLAAVMLILLGCALKKLCCSKGKGKGRRHHQRLPDDEEEQEEEADFGDDHMLLSVSSTPPKNEKGKKSGKSKVKKSKGKNEENRLNVANEEEDALIEDALFGSDEEDLANPDS